MSLYRKFLKSATLVVIVTLLAGCKATPSSTQSSDELTQLLEQMQRKGLWSEAIELADIQLKNKLADKDRIYFLVTMGQCNRMKEAYETSESLFRKVIQYDHSKYPEVGRAYYGIGDLHYLKWSYFRLENQLDTAIAYVNKAREIAESSGNDQLLSQCLYRLGTIEQIQENNETAMEKFNEASRLSHSVSDTAGIIRSSTHKAVGFQRVGTIDSAGFYYNRSLKLASAANIYYSESHALANLGKFYQDQGQLDSALHYYNRALFLSEKLDQSLLLCKSNLRLGQYYIAIGDDTEALKYIESGHVIAERVGYKNFLSYFESMIAELKK